MSRDLFYLSRGDTCDRLLPFNWLVRNACRLFDIYNSIE